MAPALKWARVLLFFSLIVMTTAMAASPVRQVVSPIVAKSFARWSGNMTPAVAPLNATSERLLAQVTSHPTVERSRAAEFTIATAASSASNVGVSDRFDYASTAATAISAERDNGLTPDQLAALANRSASRFDLGPWQPGNSGSASRGGSASLARGNRSTASTGSVGSTASSGSGGNAAAGSGNGGSSSAGGGSGAGPTRVPTPTPGEASSVFTEYTNGLPVLTGTGAAGSGAVTSLTTTAVAANPEPSTLLLLGSGIVAVAGALRRRIARQV